jgi:rfaE bifunctional protein nucleotidyltransferase chain/domain
MSKIKTIREIVPIVEHLKKEGKVIVTTNGAFDLFHAGHLKSLKFAKKQGDVLIVCLNSDSSVKKYKSKERPIYGEKERTDILCAMGIVDYVVLFNDENPIRILDKIKPNVHIKGSEYEGKIIEEDIVEKNDGKVIFLKRKRDGLSTTEIIERIARVKK